MAKVAKPKNREISVHSRAARRQASPQPDTSRTKAAAAESNEHWMYSTQNAGVSKKSKPKKLTHAQRVRQAKAAERAEKNVDVFEAKVAQSKQKGRKVQARRKDWDELNGRTEHEVAPINQPMQESDAEEEAMDIEAGLDTIVTGTHATAEQVSIEESEVKDALQMQDLSHNASEKTIPLQEVDIIT